MNIKEVEILLVEDSTDDAELIIRALKSNKVGNEIVWVKDGEKALESIFGTTESYGHSILLKPRLILLDLKLPKVDGIEVLQKLKSSDLTRNIPVVMMTSSQENSDLKKCYELGVNSYVVKPIVFDDFLKATEKIGLYWLLVNQGADHV